MKFYARETRTDKFTKNPCKMIGICLDTETATLPWADEIAKGNAEIKKKIAIAKPLVYDIGWIVHDRNGNVLKSVNYLVQETFFVPNIFNTAYYCNKRPIYMQMLVQGLIVPACWDEIIAELIDDMMGADFVEAYNACFDFKKAIPYTERYIRALYSEDYNRFERGQRYSCKKIAEGQKCGNNADYLEPIFSLRDVEIPIIDLWGLACDRLINIDKYRNFCLEEGLLTDSAMYFKTSAETSFRYLENQHDFIESHTALDDARIELMIFVKAMKRGAVEPLLKAFPFRELGTTNAYVLEKKPKYIPVVADAYKDYFIRKKPTRTYRSKLLGIMGSLGVDTVALINEIESEV